ncbi:MAG TPA: hypothetical protein VII37_07330, partial [Candidatus Acidoferrum sp.]
STGDLVAQNVSTFQDAAASVAAIAKPGDMILTLGAGSVGQLAPMILEKLRATNIAASIADSI